MQRARQAFRRINGKNPRQYGFDFGLWTRHTVARSIAERFGVEPDLGAAGKPTADLRLTPQQPLTRAGWFAPCKGRASAEPFVVMRKTIRRSERRPRFLVLESSPADKAKSVPDHGETTNGKLELRFPPGCAP